MLGLVLEGLIDICLFPNLFADEDVETNSVVTEAVDDAATEHRIIFVNQLQPTRYCNNHISTAKYSALSFVPSFLFEQFRRYSNCFFLFIALLQVGSFCK